NSDRSAVKVANTRPEKSTSRPRARSNATSLPSASNAPAGTSPSMTRVRATRITYPSRRDRSLEVRRPVYLITDDGDSQGGDPVTNERRLPACEGGVGVRDAHAGEKSDRATTTKPTPVRGARSDVLFGVAVAAAKGLPCPVR